MNLGAYKGRVHKPSKVGPRAGGFFLSFLALLLSPFPAQAEDQKNCLAEAVYFEARSEPLIGQIAVAGVVLERVQRPEYPDNVCDVVHQGHYVGGMPIRNRCAFSYWCDGKPEEINDELAWGQALYVAELALDGVRVADTETATHYHASYVKPNWSDDMTFMARIGLHLFYGD